MTNTYGPLDNQILSSLEDGVLEIILNRPEKHNALTYPMYEELTRLLTAAADNPATRVVLVTGTGDFFSSGNDVNSFVWGAELAYHEKPSFQFMNTLAGFQKPIIAAVNGNAIGIGFTMLLHFDLIYASDTSRFRMPFLSMGFIPEFASTLLLPSSLGHTKAAELLMIGDYFSSQHAQTLGIVNQLTATDGVIELARKNAANLASKSPEAVRTTKMLMKKHSAGQVLATIDEEAEEFSKCLRTPEAQAIIARFLNKDEGKQRS
jgi:enoyl-CoA hydratase/carnithine racemase